MGYILWETFKGYSTHFKVLVRKKFLYFVILGFILFYYFYEYKLNSNNNNMTTTTKAITTSIKSSSTTTSNTTTTNSTKNMKIFCFILAHPENFFHRTTIVWNTWAKECDGYKFISTIPNIYLPYSKKKLHGSIETNFPFPLLQPANFSKEVYQKLTDKIYLTLIELYKSYNNFDWYLKADDDTFIFIDHLKEFIANKNPEEPLKYGYNLKTWQSGGAGYLLSKKSLEIYGKKLIEDKLFCPNTGVEDQDMSGCAQKLQINQPNSVDTMGRERFHPFNVTTHLFGDFPNWIYSHSLNQVKKGKDCCSEKTISFHYMSYEQINKMYFLWQSFKAKIFEKDDFYSMLYKMFE